jgi:hypothetical protein
MSLEVNTKRPCETIIEIIRNPAPRTFLYPSAKWIILKRDRSARTGQNHRTQSVFKIPGVLGNRSGIRFAESVAVVVVGKREIRGCGELVRRVVVIRRHAQRGKPIPNRVICIALSGRSPLGHLRELVNRIVNILLSHIVELVSLGRAIAGIAICITCV